MKFFERSALTGEFGRFLCVGAFNTVFGYVLYCALLLALPYGAAYTASYLIGIVISYFLNCRFVFRRPPSWRTALRFPAAYVVQYALGLTLLTVFVERFHMDRRVAAAGVVFCSVFLTFVLSRVIIRSGPEHRSAASGVSHED
jgi:putative flippase GtrA